VDRPTTYKEAIEFAKKFLQFSSDWMAKDPANKKKSLGVPIKVWLYPLVLMQYVQGAPALRYEISLTFASQCVGIMENYSQVEDELVLMLEDPLLKKLCPLHKKLQLFQRCLTSFIAELKRKLGEIVVGIRSGQDSAADSFRHLTTRITNEQFPFNSNRLNQWLLKKHKELCIIRRFQDEAKNKLGNQQSKVNFFPSARTLQQQMSKFSVDFGFEFSFSYLALPELFLELLTQTLDTDILNEISTETNNLNDVLWCENSSICKRIEKEITIFAELVNENSNDEKFTFAMTAPDEYNEICANDFSIIFHHKQNRSFGWDAVLIACQHYPKERIIDVIRLSVEEEIPEELNPFPLIALCLYYKKDNLIDIVRLLIWKNIDVNCKQDDGWNALHLVCRYYDKDNLIDIVRFLIEAKIDVNCKINNGWNALHLVCWGYKNENLIDIVRLLIGKNIDVNCKTNDGDNALTLLCQHYKKDNLIDIVRFLIEKNIDVNCKNNARWNALHFVCMCLYMPKTNLVDLVSILVRHKIDKKVKTTGGGTARSFLLNRFKEDEVANILKMLDS
jgi:ankyrin repeat protein